MKMDEFRPITKLVYDTSQSILIDGERYQFPILFANGKVLVLDEDVTASTLSEKLGDLDTLLVASDNLSIKHFNERFKWPLEDRKIGTDLLSTRAVISTFMILNNEGRRFAVLFL